MAGDETIYIDCSPVNEYGETETEKDDRLKKFGGTDAFLDDATNLIDSGQILDNVGIQVVIGVTFFAIIYGLGQYVFKSIPKSMYDKQRFNM